jgi:orotate phosphoribosyltransferase
MFEAIDTLTAAGIEVVQAVSLVDRSDGEVEREADRRRLLYTALISPADLGVA